jgi:hypothetical protein
MIILHAIAINDPVFISYPSLPHALCAAGARNGSGTSTPNCSCARNIGLSIRTHWRMQHGSKNCN